MKSQDEKEKRLQGKFVIEGKPTPWARAGMSKGTLYDTQKKLKLVHGITIAGQHKAGRLFKGPLHFAAVFYFKTRYKDRWGKFHSQIPDTDNCLKYLMDMSKSVLYQDDGLVARITALKIWSPNERTEFIITELADFPDHTLAGTLS